MQPIQAKKENMTPDELNDCERYRTGSKELDAASSPSGLDKVAPKRQFVRRPMTTCGVESAESIESDKSEQTDLQRARDNNRHDKAHSPREFVDRFWDVPPDASRQDDESSTSRQQRKEIGQARKNGVQRDSRTRQIEELLGCAYRASIFCNNEGVPFAVMPGETISQWDVASLHSREFASFLRQEYYAQYGQFPQEARIRVVRDLLDRDASRRTASPPIALRVARGLAEQGLEPAQPEVLRQVIALDLGRRSPADGDSVLEIDAAGWSVNHSSGFAFLRPRGHRPLPLPEPAGPEALNVIKDLLRVDGHDWLRILIWLLAAMRPKGPYPILVLLGRERSGISQAAKMLKSLLDPAAVPFQPLASNPNTLLRQAHQTWIQAFDHVTGMPRRISSALCRLSTCAASTHSLHGNPITVSVARPIVMTVPTDGVGAAWKPTGDLLDRMLTVTLPPLTEEATRPESEIAEKFERVKPKILGALAQAVSVAMGRVEQIHLTSYPSHAESAIWAIAAAPALNIPPESLHEALAQKRQFPIPKDPLQQKIAILLATREAWHGTATNLKLELDVADAPNHLSRKLKEIRGILQAEGIEISFPRRQENGQLVRITKLHEIRQGWTSRSAADLPVEHVDRTSILTAPTVAPQIEHQIVSAEENKRERITVPPPADRQALTPAGTAAAPPTELARAGARETEPEERTFQAALSPGVVTAGARVTTIFTGRRLECTTGLASESEAILESMQHMPHSDADGASMLRNVLGRNFVEPDRLDLGLTAPTRFSTDQTTVAVVELPWTQPPFGTDRYANPRAPPKWPIPP